MKKIIHMSDLHIGFEGLEDKFRLIIKRLIAEKGDQASEFIIVITGDLAENAHKQEAYREVQKGFDDLKQAGFEDILVVPGNHDYGTGSLGDKKFVKSFQEMFFGAVTGYPRVNIIDDIALIGLDSMAEELHWYDALWSEGELGAEQLNKLSLILKEDDVYSAQKRVIYLHHHPFDQRPLHQLKDSRELEKVLTSATDKGISIDALLYGHNHEGAAHNGAWGINRCYDAGSATEKPRPKAIKDLKLFEVHSAIRIMDIEQEHAAHDYVLRLLK